MRKKRLCAAISAAMLCISMLGNVPMVSMAQESATGVEVETEADANVATGSDAGTDVSTPTDPTPDEGNAGEDETEPEVSIEDWEYSDNEDGTVTITGYKGSDTEVVIPGQIDGKSVTSIGARAFQNHEYYDYHYYDDYYDYQDTDYNYDIDDYYYYEEDDRNGELFGPDKLYEDYYECIASNVRSIEIPSSVTSIGAGAFYYCVELESIKIPSTVTCIGNSAFGRCYSLTNIEIPTSVTSIGNNAFEYCWSLTSIEIPSSVTSIGAGAFYKCSSLTRMEIPSSVTSIGNSAFERCYRLTSIEIPEGVTSIGNSAFGRCYRLTSIKIPEGMMSIGAGAFNGCSSLTSIEIPSSVTSIGAGAFNGCSSLTSIKIPTNVTSIGNCTFRNCSSLTSIEIPEGVTSIRKAAFRYCSSLTSIEIPEGVTSIGLGAFDGCSSLTSIEIPSSVTSIGAGAFYRCSGLTGKIVIPKGVTSIESSAFENCYSLTSIEIPSSVTRIEYSAFRNCYSLTSIEIPSSMTSIGNYAFYGCSGLTGEIVIPEGVTSIGNYAFYGCSGFTGEIVIPEGVTSIGNYAFYGCSGLTGEIVIPEGVTSIGNCAFYGCSGFTGEIVILEGVTSIGNSAFSGCSGLTSIKLPSSVTSISWRAFYNCSSLVSIDVSADNVSYKSINGILYDSDVKTLICCPKGMNGAVEIPEGVTSIESSAFENCYSLTSIEIPSSVTSIESSAFENCYSLTSIEIPSSVTSIESSAFENCYNLTSIEIPASVTSIGWCAFYGCSGLTSIEIPSSVTSIKSSAFYECGSLTNIEIPASVTSIGNSAFRGCSSLVSIDVNADNISYKSINGILYDSDMKTLICCPAGISGTVEIPEGLTSIGSYAFEGCSNLTSIEIPSSVTSIRGDAFSGCSSLTSIEIPSSVTWIWDCAFNGCSSLVSIDVNVDNISYKSINGILYDSDMKTLICCPGGMSGVVEIPEGVTSIVKSAFSDCSSLTSIEIPPSVVRIGYSVDEDDSDYYGDTFVHCSSLQSINVNPDNVNYKSVDGVLYDSDMKTLICYPAGIRGAVQIPEGVRSIGTEAFSGCSSLTSIEIPSSVASIGWYAFRDCDNLTIYGITGSTAENYAKKNDIPFVAIFYEPVTGHKAQKTEAKAATETEAGNIEYWYCSSCGKYYSDETLTEEITEESTVIPAKGHQAVKTEAKAATETEAGNIEYWYCSECGKYYSDEALTEEITEESTVIPAKGHQAVKTEAKAATETEAGNIEYWYCSECGRYYSDEALTEEITEESTVIPATGPSASTGDWEYSDNGDGTVTITEYEGSDTELVLPGQIGGKRVTGVGDWAFAYCRSLTSVEIPSGVSSIGRHTFSGCRNLTGIEIPASVTDIEEGAFAYCRSLTDMVIPSGVTRIGDYAFEGCSGLTGIEIPESVTEIGVDAFFWCDNITIYGFAGTEAERYARENNIPFSAIARGTDFSGLTVCAKKATYNGEKQTAELYIQNGKDVIPLTENVDYTGTVEREAAGTTTVRITGKGRYTGETEVSFTVEPLNLKDAQDAGLVEFTAGDLEYTGRLQLSPVTVTYNGMLLTEDEDYTLTGHKKKTVGTSWAVVDGTGNYTGRIKVKYALKKATQPIMLYSPSKVRTVKAENADAKLQLKTSRIRENAEIVYSVEKPNPNISVTSDGMVTVKKGTKPGKYRIKVLAQSTQYYKATSKYFTIVVK